MWIMHAFSIFLANVRKIGKFFHIPFPLHCRDLIGGHLTSATSTKYTISGVKTKIIQNYVLDVSPC